MNRIKIVIRNLIIIITLPFLIAAQNENREYAIKAALLQKFTLFIEWPAEIDSLASLFNLTVIGNNPFNNILDKSFQNNTIKNKKVNIEYISDIEQIKDCQLLFISGKDEKTLKKIISYTKKRSILTISDTKGYAERGVHINFYQAENKIRFEINERAVKESGLFMSYQLFSLARIVKTRTNE